MKKFAVIKPDGQPFFWAGLFSPATPLVLWGRDAASARLKLTFFRASHCNVFEIV